MIEVFNEEGLFGAAFATTESFLIDSSNLTARPYEEFESTLLQIGSSCYSVNYRTLDRSLDVNGDYYPYIRTDDYTSNYRSKFNSFVSKSKWFCLSLRLNNDGYNHFGSFLDGDNVLIIPTNNLFSSDYNNDSEEFLYTNLDTTYLDGSEREYSYIAVKLYGLSGSFDWGYGVANVRSSATTYGKYSIKAILLKNISDDNDLYLNIFFDNHLYDTDYGKRILRDITFSRNTFSYNHFSGFDNSPRYFDAFLATSNDNYINSEDDFFLDLIAPVPNGIKQVLITGGDSLGEFYSLDFDPRKAEGETEYEEISEEEKVLFENKTVVPRDSHGFSSDYFYFEQEHCFINKVDPSDLDNDLIGYFETSIYDFLSIVYKDIFYGAYDTDSSGLSRNGITLPMIKYDETKDISIYYDRDYLLKILHISILSHFQFNNSYNYLPIIILPTLLEDRRIPIKVFPKEISEFLIQERGRKEINVSYYYDYESNSYLYPIYDSSGISSLARNNFNKLISNVVYKHGDDLIKVEFEPTDMDIFVPSSITDVTLGDDLPKEIYIEYEKDLSKKCVLSAFELDEILGNYRKSYTVSSSKFTYVNKNGVGYFKSMPKSYKKRGYAHINNDMTISFMFKAGLYYTPFTIYLDNTKRSWIKIDYEKSIIEFKWDGRIVGQFNHPGVDYEDYFFFKRISIHILPSQNKIKLFYNGNELSNLLSNDYISFYNFIPIIELSNPNGAEYDMISVSESGDYDILSTFKIWNYDVPEEELSLLGKYSIFASKDISSDLNGSSYNSIHNKLTLSDSSIYAQKGKFMELELLDVMGTKHNSFTSLKAEYNTMNTSLLALPPNILTDYMTINIIFKNNKTIDRTILFYIENFNGPAIKDFYCSESTTGKMITFVIDMKSFMLNSVKSINPSNINSKVYLNGYETSIGFFAQSLTEPAKEYDFLDPTFDSNSFIINMKQGLDEFDEIQIFDRALTSEEILNLYKCRSNFELSKEKISSKGISETIYYTEDNDNRDKTVEYYQYDRLLRGSKFIEKKITNINFVDDEKYRNYEKIFEFDRDKYIHGTFVRYNDDPYDVGIKFPDYDGNNTEIHINNLPFINILTDGFFSKLGLLDRQKAEKIIIIKEDSNNQIYIEEGFTTDDLIGADIEISASCSTNGITSISYREPKYISLVNYKPLNDDTYIRKVSIYKENPNMHFGLGTINQKEQSILDFRTITEERI